jgi:hypothetical protein
MWELFSNKKKKLYVLENLFPYIIDEDDDDEIRTKCQRHIDDDEYATCVMLADMLSKL